MSWWQYVGIALSVGAIVYGLVDGAKVIRRG